jgi:hypothetical protein
MMSTFLGDGKERGGIWTSLALCPRDIMTRPKRTKGRHCLECWVA